MAMSTASPWTGMALGSKVSTSRSFSSSPLQRYGVLSLKRGRSFSAPSLLSEWRLHYRQNSPSNNPPAAMSSRNDSFCSGSERGATVVARAKILEGEQTASVDVKEFLEDLKAVGRVRLIVNTGVAVLESVTHLEKLFYHTLPGRGEYVNLMLKEDNVDFHLLIDQVVSAKLETGKSSRGDIPTYMIRFIDNNEAVAASVLVMWKHGTNGDYDDGQVDAYQNLLNKYGPEITFAAKDSQ